MEPFQLHHGTCVVIADGADWEHVFPAKRYIGEGPTFEEIRNASAKVHPPDYDVRLVEDQTIARVGNGAWRPFESLDAALDWVRDEGCRTWKPKLQTVGAPRPNKENTQ